MYKAIRNSLIAFGLMLSTVTGALLYKTNKAFTAAQDANEWINQKSNKLDSATVHIEEARNKLKAYDRFGLMDAVKKKAATRLDSIIKKDELQDIYNAAVNESTDYHIVRDKSNAAFKEVFEKRADGALACGVGILMVTGGIVMGLRRRKPTDTGLSG